MSDYISPEEVDFRAHEVEIDSQKGSKERDLSRAIWQRTVGSVLVTQVADLLFAEGEVVLPERDEWSFEKRLQASRLKPCWFLAGDMVEGLIQGRLDNIDTDAIHRDLPRKTRNAVAEQTHYGDRSNNLAMIFQEAVKSQVFIPINTLMIIEAAAENQRQAGHEHSSLETVGQSLRRPDVREIIKTLLFARNGALRDVSVMNGIEFKSWRGKQKTNSYLGAFMLTSVEFNDDQTVSTSSRFNKALRDTVREVNEIGDSLGVSSVYSRPSSGCPARHLAPHPVEVKPYLGEIEAIGKVFGKSLDELLAPRRQSVIEDGLDFMATILENHAAYRSGELTTYSSSAQSRASAGQPSAAHA